MSSYHTDSGGQTTTTTTTQITPLIWFDREYIHSNTGLLNLVVIILDLAAFIIAQFFYQSGRVAFFCFTSMSAFWISLTLFALYAFHVVEKLHYVQWLLGEFAFCLIWSMFFFVSSLLMLIAGRLHIVAAIFGFISCGIYGYQARENYQRYSRGEIAQGERSTTGPTVMA